MLPITEQILGKIVGALCNICSNTYESKLFTAAYTLAFFAFLRVGETVLTECNDSHSILSLGINDVRLENNQLTFKIRSCKTDQLGKGITIVLFETPMTPVVRLKLSGPLFCHYRGDPLPRYQFAAAVD